MSSSSSRHNTQGAPSKPRHHRKPVPPFLPEPEIPPRRESILSNAAALRRFVQYASPDPPPPLPDNWAENIARHGGHHRRRSSPDSDFSVGLDAPHGVTGARVKTAAQKAEKALPQVPSLHEARRQSDDAGSTLAESTRSMKLEAAESSESIRPLRPRRSMPSINRELTTPSPAGVHNGRRASSDQTGVASMTIRPRLVYAQHEGGNTYHLNRNARVWGGEVSDSGSDFSLPATVVDGRKDVGERDSFHDWEKTECLQDQTGFKCGSLGAPYGRHSTGLRTGLRHALRGLFCLKSRPGVRY